MTGINYDGIVHFKAFSRHGKQSVLFLYFMQRGYVIQLYPNETQKVLLAKHFGSARWVYNHMIVVQQKRYHRTGKGMSGYDLQNMLPKIKKQYPWLAEVNSQSLQIVCHDLASAYTRFFKKKAQYPAFKKKGNGGSFTCINNSRIEERHIRLPKLGLIRFRGGDRPEGDVKRFTVRERAGKYYCSVLFDDGRKEPKPRAARTITGLDMGLTDMVTTSNGDAHTAPKFMKAAKKELQRKQKALSRCVKGSKRRAKAKLAVAKLHAKVSNQRKDFNHKSTHILISDSENKAFGIESLAVRNMMKNHKLAGAIADAGWYQFRSFLTYKAAAVGKQVIEVDRFYPSSKTCSACGVVRQSLLLSYREWTCDDCGYVHDRDINAAINIAKEAARNVVLERGGRVSPVAIRHQPLKRVCINQGESLEAYNSDIALEALRNSARRDRVSL
jgi:putative transposase